MLSRVLSRRLLSLAGASQCVAASTLGSSGTSTRPPRSCPSTFGSAWSRAQVTLRMPKSCFGQLFDAVRLDFQRRLLAKKRKFQDSLDAMAAPTKTMTLTRPFAGSRASPTTTHRPTPWPANKSMLRSSAHLQAVLTKQEFFVYTMLFVDEMPVKDIAARLESALEPSTPIRTPPSTKSQRCGRSSRNDIAHP
jgi:hypothetical protein